MKKPPTFAAPAPASPAAPSNAPCKIGRVFRLAFLKIVNSLSYHAQINLIFFLGGWLLGGGGVRSGLCRRFRRSCGGGLGGTRGCWLRGSRRRGFGSLSSGFRGRLLSWLGGRLRSWLGGRRRRWFCGRCSRHRLCGRCRCRLGRRGLGGGRSRLRLRWFLLSICSRLDRRFCSRRLGLSGSRGRFRCRRGCCWCRRGWCLTWRCSRLRSPIGPVDLRGPRARRLLSRSGRRRRRSAGRRSPLRRRSAGSSPPSTSSAASGTC